MSVLLGSSGCISSNGDKCDFLRSDLAGYACAQHKVPLSEHWRGGQPVRANVCGDESGKDSWSRIMSARQ